MYFRARMLSSGCWMCAKEASMRVRSASWVRAVFFSSRGGWPAGDDGSGGGGCSGGGPRGWSAARSFTPGSSPSDGEPSSRGGGAGGSWLGGGGEPRQAGQRLVQWRRGRFG